MSEVFVLVRSSSTSNAYTGKEDSGSVYLHACVHSGESPWIKMHPLPV